MRDNRDKVGTNLEYGWLCVVNRLKDVGRKTLQSHNQKSYGGVAVLRLLVIVDAEGVPRFWLEPQGLKVEPAHDAQELLRVLSNGLE